MFIDIHGFPFNNHAEGASKAMAKQVKTFPTSQESAWSSFAKTTLGEARKDRGHILWMMGILR